MRPYTNEELCNYFRSFVGMDGGNLEHAKLWLCGIEHGGVSERLETIIPEFKAGAWSIERRTQEDGLHRTWPLWERMAKIVVSIRRNVLKRAGAEVDDLTWEEYRDNYLYGEKAYEFKLNLFPLASPEVNSRSWASIHNAQPELGDKEQYRNLCRHGGRFEFMRDLRAKHGPKVIIATGVTSREDFASAFGFKGCPREEILIGDQGNQRCLHVYVDRDANGAESRLVVTPFPSYRRYCLNSDALLEALGARVSTWMGPDDFPDLPGPVFLSARDSVARATSGRHQLT